MAPETYQTFDEVRTRLDEIVDEVNAEGVTLDEALKLYEEAVKLGLRACDMSEEDAEAVLAQDAAEQDAAEQDAPAETAEVAAEAAIGTATDAAELN